MKYPKLPDGKKYIFRAWKTVNGVRVYARDEGLKAFCFIVDDIK